MFDLGLAMASSSSDHAAAAPASIRVLAKGFREDVSQLVPALVPFPRIVPAKVDAFFILIKEMPWGDSASMIRRGEASIIFHVAEDGEHISDIHLARIMVKLVRQEEIKFHEKVQNVHSFIMQTPSLLFEKVGKLHEIGKGFTCLNCKDTHLKVFIDRRAFNSLCGELSARICLI